MKKFLALLLALIMVISLAACTNEPDPTEPPTSAPTQGNTPTTEPTEAPTTEPTEAPTYTYDVNLTEFPTLWNPHTYTTNTSSSIMSYIMDAMYTFDYNEDESGFALVPSMAAEEPIDITADYVGQYGIKEGDTGRVYKFVLRDDLAWEDGTVINAHSFVESAKRLLNPAAQNFRADTMYSGAVQILNTKNYLKQGKTVNDTMADQGLSFATLVKNDDGTYSMPTGEPVYFPIDIGGNYLGDPLSAYIGAYGSDYFSLTYWEDLKALVDPETGCVPVTDDTYKYMLDIVTGNPAWNEDESYLPMYMQAEITYPEMAWDEVGIFALSDNELVYVLVKPSAGFDLKYSLPDSYLVHLETYDACESIDENGLYTNTYGTSVETTKSYGTYNMVSFQADKEVHFVRNDDHFTVADGHYQATDVIIHCVPEAQTRLQMLISGELDTYGLQTEDMDKYLMSDYTYLSSTASVWGMVFNPNKEALETKQAEAGDNINKTILTVLEFRQAMAYGMNRTEFSLATMPTCTPTFGLLSNQHIVDVEAGTGYRSTEVAKQVLADFWGLSNDIGEGKLYADLDEAVDAITGYNPTLAQAKFNEAYDKAIADGLMDEDDTIQICIGLPSATSSIYNNGYEFIVNNYTELVKGTKLEGKLTFTRDDTIGDNFGGALRDNQVDMLFYVGFSGSELDPYNLMSVYVDGGNLQYDPCVNYKNINMTVELDGTEWTTTVYNWYEIMNGTAHTITDAEGNTKEYSCGAADNDPESRMQILGTFEGAIMMNYDFIPLSGDSSAQLVGQQVQFHSDEYMYGVGFGGLKYMTFNYSDAEWADYVASQNGELDYT